MALTPELDLALATAEKWREYQSKALKEAFRIEVCFQEFASMDFSGYEFNECDFQAVNFLNINFDNCNFIDCTFYNCTFENVSIVGAEITDCKIKGSDIEIIVVRGTCISKCQIENSNFKDIDIMDSAIFDIIINGGTVTCLRSTNTTLSSVSIDSIELVDISYLSCDANKYSISNCNFTSLHIKQTEFSECSITDITATTGVFLESNAHRCKLVRPNMSNLSFSECNIFFSQLIDVDLNELQIDEIGLLGSFLTNCKWPNQKYSVGFFGKYTPATNLLRQPVEDIQGLTPSLRSEIRQSQLVNERVKRSKRPLSRFGMWFWAVTTEYGRSIVRLTILCFSVILVLSSLYWIVSIPNVYWTEPCLWLSNWNYLANGFWMSIRHTVLNFVGIEYLPDTANYRQETLFIITRFTGLVFFGLWIGVAANKFGSPN